MPHLIRVSEAAAIGQVSEQTIRNLIDRGQLKGTKIDPTRSNSPIRLVKSEVEQYFQPTQSKRHQTGN